MISISGQDSYGYVLGQYCFFLVHLHGRIFFWTGAVFSKMNFISLDDVSSGDSFSSSDRFLFSNASNTSIGIPTGFPGLTVLLSWLFSRYQYHFPVEGMILITAMLMRPVAYFHYLIRTGNKFNLIALVINDFQKHWLFRKIRLAWNQAMAMHHIYTELDHGSFEAPILVYSSEHRWWKWHISPGDHSQRWFRTIRLLQRIC